MSIVALTGFETATPRFLARLRSAGMLHLELGGLSMAYEWDEARATSAFDQNGVCLGIDDVSAQDPCCLTFDGVSTVAALR